jgi:di/tricarboxylate transporter
MSGSLNAAAGRRGIVSINLVVRVTVELASYAALGYFGANLHFADWLRAVFALALPAAAIVVWALLLAPRARWPLADPAALLLELVVFVGAAVALGIAGSPVAAVVLGVVASANAMLLRVFHQHNPTRKDQA